MRILITGAGGFIGSRLVRDLHPAHELFPLVHKLPEKSASEVDWIVQDLSQTIDYRRLPSRIDAVIHLAQSSFYKQFPVRAYDIFKVNVDGTMQLLEYARAAGARKFIFTSTGGVYGSNYEKFVETDPVNPLNFYLSSKYMAELLVANYQQYFNTMVFRLFFVYGAGQKPAMLIPRLVRSVAAGEAVTLQGTNGIHINPVYVDDVVAAFARALDLSGHHLINIGGPQVLSLREITRIIGERVGRQPVFATSEVEEPNHLVGDITKMSVLLGDPRMPFAEGVAEVCGEVAREHATVN